MCVKRSVWLCWEIHRQCTRRYDIFGWYERLHVCFYALSRRFVYVYGLAYENHAFYMNVLVLLLLNIIVFAGRYFVTVVALTLYKFLLYFYLPFSLSFILSHFHRAVYILSVCNAVIFPLVIIVVAAY